MDEDKPCVTITENTDARLIVDHVPWGVLGWRIGFMSIWVAGSIIFILDGQLGGAVVFIALGTFLPLIIIWLTVARSQLVLDRMAGLAEHRIRSFRGMTRQTFQVGHIKRVYIGQNGPKQGRLFIEVTEGMDAGHHAFPNAAVPLKALKNVERDVQDWLAN